MSRKPNKRRDREEWRRIIRRQETSGKTIPEYCRQRKLSEKSFYGWRKRLGEEAEPKPETFVRVEAESRPAQVLIIQTPGGYRLEVPTGTDGSYVQTIMAAMP